jgi:spore coat polysaccharide biosynthesis protein SpsF
MQGPTMTLSVIVQARTGSSRLPAKVLHPLGKMSVLGRVLDRCAQIPGADNIICAIPENEPDDRLEREVRRLGYGVSLGPEQDVLARYSKAARDSQADYVMRVTSDCPFLDPVVCGQVIDLFHGSRADYASNTMPARFPHGLDCEIFPALVLDEADRIASDPHDREHVTPWIRNHAFLNKVNLRGPGNGIETLRWTLDYPEDLAFCEAVFDELGEGAATVGSSELAALCLRRPDLVALNADRALGRAADVRSADVLETSAHLMARAS